MPSTGLSQKILKNISWNFFGQGWLLLLSFFATPFVVHNLNIHLYGIYTLVSVVIGYFSFLQFGLVHAAIKYISQYLSADDHQKVARAFWGCIIIYIIIGVIGTAVLLAGSRLLVSGFFKISGDYLKLALVTMRLGALTLTLFLVTGILNGVIRALGRFDIINHFNLLSGTVQILGNVLLLKTGHSIREMMLFNLFLQTVVVGIYWKIIIHFLPFLSKPVWDVSVLKEMLRYGGFITICTITDPIITNIDKIFLSSLRSVASLTYYSIPCTIVSKMSIVPSAVLTVLFPIFSRIKSTHTDNLNRELHFRSILYMLYIYTFIMLFFIFFGSQFLSLWIGGDFARLSSSIMVILSAGGFLNAMAQPSTTLLLGMGKPQYPALFNFIEVVLYLPASYFFIHRFGGIGAAATWLACMLLNTLLLSRAATRLLGVSILAFYRDIARFLIPPAFAVTGAFCLLRSSGLGLLHPVTIIGILSTGIVYIVLVWLWGLDAVARSRLREAFMPLIRKIRGATEQLP